MLCDHREGMAAIHFAAAYGSEGLVRLLVEVGGLVELERLDRGGRTALHCAARHSKRPEVLRCLLAAAGAPPGHHLDREDPTTGWRPIHFAAACNSEISVLRCLLELGGSEQLGAVDGRKGMLPVQLAATQNRSKDVVYWLLENGGAQQLAETAADPRTLAILADRNADKHARHVIFRARRARIADLFRASDTDLSTALDPQQMRHFLSTHAGREVSQAAVSYILLAVNGLSGADEVTEHDIGTAVSTWESLAVDQSMVRQRFDEFDRHHSGTLSRSEVRGKLTISSRW